MKSLIYEKLVQRLQHAGLTDDGCAGLTDPADLIAAACAIRDLQSFLESSQKDSSRWKMFVELFDDVNKPYSQRVNKEAFSAYVKSLGESIDCTRAIDAAIRAKGGA